MTDKELQALITSFRSNLELIWTIFPPAFVSEGLNPLLDKPAHLYFGKF